MIAEDLEQHDAGAAVVDDVDAQTAAREALDEPLAGVKSEGDAGDEQAPKADPKLMRDGLVFAIATTSRTLAGILGEHWALEDDEAELLGDAWAPVLGEGMAPSPLQLALITTLGVVGPRAFVSYQQWRAPAIPAPAPAPDAAQARESVRSNPARGAGLREVVSPRPDLTP